MNELTDELIVSELKELIKSNLIGVLIVFLILMILIYILLRCIKVVKQRKIVSDDEQSRVSNMKASEKFIIIFLIFFCVVWVYAGIRGLEEIFIVQHAIDNHTYEIKEDEVVDKYFKTDTSESGTTYHFYIKLKNYGETNISEKEYDEIMIGDHVYTIFAVDGEKTFNTGIVYLIDEYFYQE